MRRVMGIDPGLSGGIGVLDLEEDGRLGHAFAQQTPVLKFKKNGRWKREYDLVAMRGVLVQFAVNYPVRPEIIVGLESQNPHPAEGVVSAMRLGLGLGFWEGLLAGLGIPYRRVVPLVWKRHHGLLKQPKAMSQVLVGRLFPFCASQRKVDEGPCEALLIAAYVAAHEGWTRERTARFEPEAEEAQGELQL